MEGLFLPARLSIASESPCCFSLLSIPLSAPFPGGARS